MQAQPFSPALQDELLSLCHKEQAAARAEGRDDAPDCGCFEPAPAPVRNRWFRWV